MPTREINPTASPKLGLALSGGGFRASFFHIGVLQRLAELDMLRSVEVLSTVSGGSIIGALYFLFVKDLLESKVDAEIGSEDYLAILSRMTRLFVTGVQKNPRVLAFSNVAANCRLFLPSYSRSDRMAEIYHELFYDPASGKQRITMKDLVIRPTQSENFSLRRDNSGRHARVPMLVINATTLNTGRNFQFTAIDMGERLPDRQVMQYDKNQVLLAFRYDHLPAGVHEKYGNVPLGTAVAASACVPGVFHPLPLTRLYKGFTPQLVDGGVYDNQGLESLFYEGCTDMIVSDGSGQMDTVARPHVDILSVMMRSNTILQNRIRNLGLGSLEGQPGVDQAILHLRAGLNVQTVQPGTSPGATTVYTMAEKTAYGIPQSIQLALSKLRTDLDAFSDVEAQSLMYNGYRLAEVDLPVALLQRYGADERSLQKLSTTPRLDFSSIQPFETGDRASPRYVHLLESGHDVFFKIFDMLSPVVRSVCEWLTMIVWIVLGAAVGFGSYYVPYRLVLVLGTLQDLHWLLQSAFVVISGTAFLLVLVPLFIAFIAMSHLVLINPAFIRRGKVEKL